MKLSKKESTIAVMCASLGLAVLGVFIYLIETSKEFLVFFYISWVLIAGLTLTAKHTFKRTATALDVQKYAFKAVGFLMLMILLFAFAYMQTGLVDPSNKAQSVTYTLSDALYFSAITWTTVGYGDIIPTKEARFFAAIEGLFGYIYMACIVGGLFHLYSVLKTRENPVVDER